jgi:hypothetical protein
MGGLANRKQSDTSQSLGIRTQSANAEEHYPVWDGHCRDNTAHFEAPLLWYDFRQSRML